MSGPGAGIAGRGNREIPCPHWSAKLEFMLYPPPYTMVPGVHVAVTCGPDLHQTATEQLALYITFLTHNIHRRLSQSHRGFHDLSVFRLVGMTIKL
jgi:hypothetical protein